MLVQTQCVHVYAEEWWIFSNPKISYALILSDKKSSGELKDTKPIGFGLVV